MSQNAEILAYLQAGNTLTKAEAASKGWGFSLNSRVAELRDSVGENIICWTEQRNGKIVYVYGLADSCAYG